MFRHSFMKLNVDIEVIIVATHNRIAL
jgi:hypothetical protein